MASYGDALPNRTLHGWWLIYVTPIKNGVKRLRIAMYPVRQDLKRSEAARHITIQFIVVRVWDSLFLISNYGKVRFMRKYHQKMILELLKTLEEATDNLKRLLSKKDLQSLTNLLADCQETAIQIGQFIERLKSTGKVTVTYLEEYCDLLYHANEELNKPESGAGPIKKLQKQIVKIEESVKSDLRPDKIEIAFFPYKASMWDALESIWLAAKDDPACDVYVVPIPYYDKLPDGTLGQMHYEGDKYPDYVPVVNWQDYNIEEWHPDVIFIHNPYDEGNYVTSVHPDYYSKRLREFTECLVYVPYFVGNGEHIQEHFCTLPGCVHAHKVIVQTEKEREIYVREYRKVTRESGSKFLALGSPKLDKAVSAKREDYEIPDDWKKLIRNKKVVFYNTSIDALLKNSVEDNKPSDKYLQKVKSVFEFFKKRDDAVLLWRPHPLLESTIKSMRPWMEAEYAEIVSEYKSGNYGIYDDSGDLNRAVAMSDMYYGDGSSVMKLFETAGKQVRGQVFEAAQLSFAGLYDDGTYLWFMDCCNMLYRHNKQSKKTECTGMIPGRNYWACLGIAENNNKLYFASFYKNDKIHVFDTVQKTFEQIYFKDSNKYDYNFDNVISFRNFIYFIPHEFPAIMRLNTDTNEIEYLSECIKEISKLPISKLQEAWKHIFFGYCVVNTEVAMVIHGINAVMFFDMETGNYEIRNIGDKSELYSEICFDGQNYYLASCYENHVIKWNRQTNEILIIKLPRKENKNYNFSVQYLNGHIWLFPCAANNAYKINPNTNEITELPELTAHFEAQNLDIYYNRIFVNENTIYASTQNQGIVEYNTNTRELNFIKPPPNSEINTLLYSKTEPAKTSEPTANSGQRIWEHIKEVEL